MISRTSAVRAETASTRPTRPSGTATAAFVVTPSARPRPMRMSPRTPPAPPRLSTGAQIHLSFGNCLRETSSSSSPRRRSFSSVSRATSVRSMRRASFSIFSRAFSTATWPPLKKPATRVPTVRESQERPFSTG